MAIRVAVGRKVIPRVTVGAIRKMSLQSDVVRISLPRENCWRNKRWGNSRWGRNVTWKFRKQLFSMRFGVKIDHEPKFRKL